MPKWFVHVDNDYYPGACIVDAEFAEEAVELAKKRCWGSTYEPGGEPACAVVPFEFVEFYGHPERVADLTEDDA